MSDIDIYPENLRQYWAQMGYASDERSNLETLMESGFTDAFRYLYDVMAALGEIEAAPPKGTRQKKEIPENWKHIKLKQYFAACTAASVTLTFKEIEKIDGRPLPASARKNKDWWYPRQNCNMMAEAWLTEGYSLKYINFEKGKIQLVRDELGRSKLEIPKALTSQKLPDNAVFELQQHMAYIIKKYQL